MSEPNASLLQRLFHWEATCPARRVFVQPYGPGDVREWTWSEAIDETRRMAAHLCRWAFPPAHRSRWSRRIVRTG